jgi:hypothetical protein
VPSAPSNRVQNQELALAQPIVKKLMEKIKHILHFYLLGME